MNSSRREIFDRSWKEQWNVMAVRHYDERMDHTNETETKKQKAIVNARDQLEILRNKATCPTDFDDEVRKINEDRDTTLESINKQSEERMRIIEEYQQMEHADHVKAHKKALAYRSAMGGAPTTMTIDDIETVNRRSTASTSQTPASKSPGPPHSRMSPAEDVVPTAAAPREQDQSAMSEMGFSASVQREFAADGKEQYVLRYKTKNRKALQESMESQAKRPLRIDTSVEPLPTPISMASTTGDELGASKTITFDEIYQSGQAKHKDTIVEFPPDSRQWYILKCEEHEIRFGQRPMAGAAKHLNGQPHGCQPRSWAMAVKMLGYRVIDCNEQLAELNNKVVSDAFANGYKPVSNRNPENRMTKHNKHAAQEASDNADHGTETIAISKRKGATRQTDMGQNSSSSSFRRQRKTRWKSPKDIITNPKTFHVYNCFWSPERRLYPVMILGWDDQKPGGIEKDLVATGLLDKEESSLPSCYVYRCTEGSTNAAIVGWSTGFEDGGSRVKDRKFPVMFLYVQRRGFPPPLLYDLVPPVFSYARNLSDYKLHVFFQKIPFVHIARLYILCRKAKTDLSELSDKHLKFSWGWVSAKYLSEFPLYKPDPPKKEDDPFNSARCWIAKKEGFSSWDEFEETRKEKAQEMRGGSITTPLVSPITDAGDCSDDSGAEGSARSSISNVTEKELQDMQNTAGEINGDSDYSNSDEDSTLGVWKQPEDDGRPWAFYGLRNAENTKTGLAIPARGTEPKNTKDALSTHEVMKTARSSSVHECTQENMVLAKRGQVSPVHTAQSNNPNHAERGVSTILYTSTDVLNTPLPSVADLEEDLKGVKRARSEDEDQMNVDIPRQDNAKKAKLDVDTSDNQAANSTVSEQDPTPVSPVLHSFLPRLPLGPAAFELSFFSKGPLSWNRESEASSIGLYYGEGNRMVSTIDGLVKIVIDPTTLRGFMREEIPGSNGNSTMTLLAKNSSDASVKVVFDRARGSKVDIGKIQVRSFIRWLRSINPAVQLLEE